jgi:hypothetical protein
MPRRENARASEESLGIRREADSPAEKFAKNGPVACYGVRADWFIRDEERGASRALTRGAVKIRILAAASPNPVRRVITVAEHTQNWLIRARCHLSTQYSQGMQNRRSVRLSASIRLVIRYAP